MSVHDWPWNVQLLVQPATIGTATITRFTLTREECRLHNLREALNYSGRRVQPGEYMRLNIQGHGLVMSNTPSEIGDHRGFLHSAYGKVLIAGLGLGFVVQALFERPEHILQSLPLEHITVLEINPDVIALVAPRLLERYDGRLTVIQADALEWNPPGASFDTAWYDIWDDICSDNKPQYTKLFRRWGRRVKLQQAWCKDEVYRRE
jgi:hypothetical protein